MPKESVEWTISAEIEADTDAELQERIEEVEAALDNAADGVEGVEDFRVRMV